MGAWRQAGVGGEVACGLERGPVTELEQDQDWGRRVVIEHPLVIIADALPLQQSLFRGRQGLVCSRRWG